MTTPMTDNSTALLVKSSPVATKSFKRVDKSKLTYDYHGGIKHTKDSCFFLHGLHPMFGVTRDPSKMPKNQKGKSRTTQSNAPLQIANVVMLPTEAPITEDKYHHLLNLLNNHSLTPTTDYSAGLDSKGYEGDW